MVLLDDFLANKSLGDLSDQELIDAFKDSPHDVLKRVNWANPDSLVRQRLAKIIDRNVPLRLTLDKMLDRYPSLKPLSFPDPAPQPESAAEAIPEFVPGAEETEGARARPKNDINENNAEDIKNWLNGLRTGFFDYLGQSKDALRTAQTTHAFTQHLWDYLTLYRGHIVGHYLSEGAWEMIFSALGPIGNMMRAAYSQNLSWTMAWQKNLINPNAAYYYLYSLPERKAFDILKYPLKGTFAILAKGGAPLIHKIHYQEHSFDPEIGWTTGVVQNNVFSPIWATQLASHKLADGLDAVSGLPSDNYKIRQADKSPLEKHVELTNESLKKALDSNDYQEIKKALNWLDGFDELYRPYGFMKGFLRKPFSNMARRLRQTERDPFSFIVSLLAGTLVDFTIGLALNAVRVATVRLLGNIKSFSIFRAKLNEFLTSNRWLKTAGAGGTNIGNFLKGTVSASTASAAYLGYQFGGFVGAGAATVAGSLYNTAVLSAQNAQLMNWIAEYDYYRGILANPKSTTAQIELAQKGLKKNFIAGFRPGPLTRLGQFFSRNWLLRVPLNSLALRSILLDVLPANILAQEILGIPIGTIINFMPAGSYLWQIRHGLSSTWTQASWRIPSWKILGRPILGKFSGKLYTTPHWRYFSLQNPDSWFSHFYRRQILPRWEAFTGRYVYQEFAEHLVDRPLTSFFRKNFLRTQPYLRNFFNPGSLFGFSLIPLLSQAGFGVFSYVLGPVIGSVAWTMGTRVIESLFPKAIPNFIPRFNAIAWAGYGLSFLTGFAFWGFNVPLWYQAAWTVGLPVLYFAFPQIGAWLSTLLSQVMAAAVRMGILAATTSSAITAWVGGLALGGITAVASVTLLIGYTFYAAFWVPFQDIVQAGPVSACFQLDQSSQVASQGWCSTVRITSDQLLEKNHITHGLLLYGYEFNAAQPQNLYASVTRTLPGQTASDLTFTTNTNQNNFNSNNFAGEVLFSSFFSSSFNVGGRGLPTLFTHLSTITDSPLSFFELLAAYPQYRGLQQIARSYEDLIAQIIEDKSADNEDSLEFYRAQEEFAKKQKAELDNIVSLWESLAQEDDLPGLQAGLQSLVEKVETTIDNNPFQAQVEDEETCSENQEVCRLYQSWPQAFTSQLTAAVVLKNRAGVLDPSQPDFDQKLDSLLALIDQKTKSTQDSLENLEQQISAYSSIIEELEDLYDLTLEELNNPDLVTLLKTYFKEIFGDNKKYYYIPSGTKYQVCLQPLPMRPGFEDIVSESPPTLVYGSSGFFNSSYCPAVNQPLSTP